MTTENELTKALDHAAKAFSEMRDAVKLKAHLLRMEVREAAPEVDEVLSEIESDLKSAREQFDSEQGEARLQAALAAMDARDRWHALEAELAPTIEELKKGGKRFLDETRLKEAFEKVNSELARNRRKSEAAQWLERAGKPDGKPFTEFVDRMRSAASDLVERLKDA